MKPIRTLLVAAVAAAGLGAAFDVPAQEQHGFRGGHGGRHHGGHWRGGHGHWYGPRIGLAIGVPFALGWGWGWGPGWYGDPYYYGPPVVYREREVIREVEPEREPATTELPRGEGSPTQGPLYMNYCASAKAYFPKVTQCPEGWKFIAPNQ